MTTPTEKPDHASNPYTRHTCEEHGGVLPEFRSHELNDLGRSKLKAIREAMSAALQVVEACIPTPSRERSIVVTKLQEANMFAARGVAEDPTNRVPG